MKIGVGAITAAGIAAVFTLLMLVRTEWSFPPIDAEQSGFRGTAMVQVADRVRSQELRDAQTAPEEPYPFFEPDPSEPLSGEFYENIQVLNDVPASEFNRMMLAITEWVVPEDYRNNPENGGGCNYCHNPANLASDEVYTKNVARTMLVMTRNINANWSEHVAPAGVNCHTCHRGNAIPEYYWVEEPEPSGAVSASAGYSSLSADPFTAYFLDEPQPIRVADEDMIVPDKGASIAMTEHTYALMMHMSTSLGVNCSYCHNSRAFAEWNQSNPMRATAWFGLQMVPDINASYILPTADWLPENRKGPTGQPFSVNCTTCHQGVNKPLNGMPMAENWPYLQTASPVFWPARDQASIDDAVSRLAALETSAD